MKTSIHEYKFPDRFLIVPNIEEYFGEFRNGENPSDVIERALFGDVAEILFVRLGALGFRFLGEGPLRSITRYQFVGQGAVPEHVMENEDAIIELQSRRLSFANFVAGAFFGHIAATRRGAISGAQFAGMDRIIGFGELGGELHLENTHHLHDAIVPKITYASEKPNHVRITTNEEIKSGLAFLSHLEERRRQFRSADLLECLSSNYQAAILHGQQHASASVAVNFSVVEALTDEIFNAYGLFGDRTRQDFAKRSHSIARISKSKFDHLNLKSKIELLHSGGLISSFLHQRIEMARKLRNSLMHEGAPVRPRQSGDMQTVVRDLWSYLVDQPFELMSAWS